MKIGYLIICIGFLYGCQQNTPLTIADLKFPNIASYHIQQHKVSKTYLISESDTIAMNHSKDTIGYLCYDTLGNITKRFTKGIFGSTVFYTYDSLQLLKTIQLQTDYTTTTSFSYKFDARKNVLFKYPTKTVPVDTAHITYGIYKFNTRGLLVESTDYAYANEEANYTGLSKYVYNHLDLLSCSETNYQLSKQDSLAGHIYKESTQYFYTNKQIDSLITTKHFIKNSEASTYTLKKIYDDRGLLDKEIDEGLLPEKVSISYSHQFIQN